jgi:hypothetical protein
MSGSIIRNQSFHHITGELFCIGLLVTVRISDFGSLAINEGRKQTFDITFQLLKQLTNLMKFDMNVNAIGQHINYLLLIFLQSVGTW